MRRCCIALVVLALVAGSCGNDDGAGVRELDGSASDSETGSGSASSSAPASGSVPAEPTEGDGGYEYATDVASHRLVVLDVCDIARLVDEGDFEGAAEVYRGGGASVADDGTVRTLAGFATREDAQHGLDDYYGTPTPLDDFVSAALEGTGPFAGEADDVRAQGVEKGVQNQLMVAWVVHELSSALEKADEGNFDPAEGAAHNWDEAWAFYHGAQPDCAPYGTADRRAADFGTVGEGDTALANEAILAAMVAGRDALLDGDLEAAEAAANAVMQGLTITYSQAAIRYATLVEQDLAEGDPDQAREHQAEGLAFWRVIEAHVVPLGVDGDAIDTVFDLTNEPGAGGGGEAVRAALRPAWETLGITDADIGEL